MCRRQRQSLEMSFKGDSYFKEIKNSNTQLILWWRENINKLAENACLNYKGSGQYKQIFQM